MYYADGSNDITSKITIQKADGDRLELEEGPYNLLYINGSQIILYKATIVTNSSSGVKYYIIENSSDDNKVNFAVISNTVAVEVSGLKVIPAYTVSFTGTVN